MHPDLFKGFCVRWYMTWSRNSIKKNVKGHAYHTFWCHEAERKITYCLYPEFSTRSLGLRISNPKGSFFSSLSCIFRFCSFVFGPPLLYMFHDIHRFQAFFCVRLFSTCSITAIMKTKKSMVPMPTTSF
jgi:hypothetical protein